MPRRYSRVFVRRYLCCYVHVASGLFRCFSSAPAMAEAMPAFPLDVRAEMQAREEKLKKENANYLEGHPDV